MKFVHIADMHFDAPFTSLNSKENLGEKRRLEQRNAFKKVIDFIEKNDIEYFFIAGDLYEQDYVKKSTIDFITKEFARIPNTKIFITPGNHDPYLKNSYYATHEFGENVFVFNSSNVEKYEDENVNIYGMAFTDFYMNSTELESITVPFSNKLNILVAHCDLNGSKDENGFSYNPVLESKLNSLGFDYIALGHVHKNNLDNKNRIYYPGSTISLGFDELGTHGMIAADMTKKSFKMEFVELDDRRFEEIEIKVDDIYSKEELAISIHADRIWLFNKINGNLRPLNIKDEEVNYKIAYSGTNITLHKETGGSMLLISSMVRRLNPNTLTCSKITIADGKNSSGNILIISPNVASFSPFL